MKSRKTVPHSKGRCTGNSYSVKEKFWGFHKIKRMTEFIHTHHFHLQLASHCLKNKLGRYLERQFGVSVSNGNTNIYGFSNYTRK